MHKRNKKIKIRRIILILIVGFFLWKIGIMPLLQGSHSKNRIEGNPIEMLSVPKSYREIFGSLQKKYNYKKIQEMRAHYQEYPLSLLTLLDKNEDAFDFVYQYPTKKNTEIGSIQTKEIKNQVPTFYQWDARWGYHVYGEDVMGITGCAPTSLSMVLSYLNQDTTLSPYKLALYAEKNGYYIEGQGTLWAFLEKTAMQYNVYTKRVNLNTTSITTALKNDHPIILRMGPGDFTETGHFIVLCGFYQDGSLIVHDPNSKQRTNKHWSIKQVLSQASAGWEFYK